MLLKNVDPNYYDTICLAGMSRQILTLI